MNRAIGDQVEVDAKGWRAFGLTVYDIGSTLRVALTGDDESKLREGQKEYRSGYSGQIRQVQPRGCRSLSFQTPLGRQVELQQFADIVAASGPTS